MKKQPLSKIAILIDADNTSPKIIDTLLAEISKYGLIYKKRIYGNWKSPNLKGWEEKIRLHALFSVQQFSSTKGKNSTDILLAIDLMDLLRTEKFDIFCIVSSDSDFAPLATRIRQNGTQVYGFGKQTTPEVFQSSCNQFNYIEKMMLPTLISNDNREDIDELLLEATNATKDSTGWVNLRKVGRYLKKYKPDFSIQKYGYEKLSHLIKDTNLFEIKNENNIIFVRAT